MKGVAQMQMTRARFLAAVFCAGVLLFSDFAYAQSKSSAPLITVYKTPT
jgi:hypothetical protein